MGYDVRQGDPLIFLMVSESNHISGATGLSPTVTIRKPGGVFASPLGAITEIGYGRYQVAGNVNDTGTLGPLSLHAEASGADPCDIDYAVVSLADSEPVVITPDTELSVSELISAARDASTISVDGHTTTERSGSEIIELDKYAASKRAAAAGLTGWQAATYTKVVPPGAMTRDE